jgi:hypothetical protein
MPSLLKFAHTSLRKLKHGSITKVAKTISSTILHPNKITSQLGYLEQLFKPS